MKLELSNSALNKNNGTEVYAGKLSDDVGYVEYRFRAPMYVESLVLDLHDLPALVGEDYLEVGVYYRQHEPFADRNPMLPLPVADLNTVRATTADTAPSHYTVLTDTLVESQFGQQTIELKTHGWYRIVGLVFELSR